ncbi:MAG TPA: hypothetical protein VGQ99_01220 [Tepidisphaeraceae bacterium]|jgi:hypothetical protein|nr:hypothetical protein [Tepidisphaeraceae bacterium]
MNYAATIGISNLFLFPGRILAHPGHSHDGFFSEIVHALPGWTYGIPLFATAAYSLYRYVKAHRQH